MLISSFSIKPADNLIKQAQKQNTAPAVSNAKEQVTLLPDYRFNANFYSKDISFTGINTVRKTVAPVLNCCHYGKKDLFRHMEDLTIRSENGHKYLDGFYTQNDAPGEINGICEELVQKAGSIIAEQFKDNYNVLALFTKGTKYNFDTHMCICMVKKNKKNDSLVADVVRINSMFKRMKELQEELYQDPSSHQKQAELGELKETYIRESNKIKRKIEHSDFWENAIFIDPSFNIVTKLKQRPKDYKLSGFNTLENNNPYNNSKQLPDKEYKTPLGFIHDIFPGLEEYGVSPDSLVLFGLSESDEKKVDIRILDPSHKNYRNISSASLNEHYPNEQLTLLINKIETELDQAAA